MPSWIGGILFSTLMINKDMDNNFCHQEHTHQLHDAHVHADHLHNEKVHDNKLHNNDEKYNKDRVSGVNFSDACAAELGRAVATLVAGYVNAVDPGVVAPYVEGVIRGPHHDPKPELSDKDRKTVEWLHSKTDAERHKLFVEKPALKVLWDDQHQVPAHQWAPVEHSSPAPLGVNERNPGQGGVLVNPQFSR